MYRAGRDRRAVASRRHLFLATGRLAQAPTATNAEQETNLRNAIASKKPILGFRVEMSTDGEKIKVAHHERLLPLTIVEQTSWKIVGLAGGRIIMP